MKKRSLAFVGILSLSIFGGTLSVHANSSPSTKDISVSATDAIEIFQKEYPDTDITALDLDSSLGKFFYEIEGINDTTEYSVKIDAKSKKILNKEKEQLDSDDRGTENRKQEKLDTDGIISFQKAGKIAKKEVGKGKATDWKLDKELDTTYWEVKVKNKKNSTEVKLDAKTGEVLSTELDD